MPRPSRNKVAQAAPVEEPAEEMEVDDEQEEGGQALQFDEPLNWRAGKAIAVAELLRRLKLLAAELKELQQEDVEKKSIVPKAQELANSQLLGHKDAGVRSYALLCIVDVFRLTAPNAPYKMNQLKEIFAHIISSIIPALADPLDPYSQQHQEILHSLSDVKSIILVSELPGSDSLVLNLFTNCFDVMSGNMRGSGRDPLSKSVEFNMTGMLIAYLDEAQTLPSGVIDILLAQFLRADPILSAGSKKGDVHAWQVPLEVSPAYNMARSVCNSVTEKMARHVGQYFNSVLIDASQSMRGAKIGKSKGRKRAYEDSDDDSESGLLTPPSDEDLHEVQKAHRLLRELWRSCPEIIRNVVPQVEAEIATENLPLRVMAVETIGDMIAGIGAAGPPPPPVLDPAAYPSQSIDPYKAPVSQNVFLVPAAPLAFSTAYPSAYQSFFDRHRDKAPLVRAAWVTEVGRIVVTSGGGKGLDSEQEPKLIRCLADMLLDTDEKVRLAAIQAVTQFDFQAVLQKLGSLGGVTTPGSVLCNLADRIKDTKPNVRSASVELLGKIWGVAAGAIAENGERVREMLGAIPSRIFEAMYVNDKSLNALVARVMFDSLLPTNFPPIKSKSGDSQRIPDSQSAGEKVPDRDRIRAERILVLVRDLEEKAKTVFFSLQHAQASKAKYFEHMLEWGEKLNSDDNKEAQAEAKKNMEALINAITSSFPDPFVAASHLNKFFKSADRRNFALSRFCISPESEYQKVNNAMKELLKRLEDSHGSATGVHETVKAFVRSAAIIVYNRSHVPAIMEFSRSDENGLGSAAHEVLKEISAKAPKVFKVHIKELCEGLKKQAPSATTSNEVTAVESLKACAGFARHFPDDMGQGRDFYKAMVKYAQFGTPPTVAKHAVSVIVASAEKKEMYIKDILKFCLNDFEYGADGFLSRLAALSQLRLLANEEIEDDDEAITEIMTGVLADNRTTPDATDPDWTDTPDDDLTAKLWALKAISNKIRGYISLHDNEEPTEDLRALSEPIFRLLNTLIEREGALSSTEESTPKHHRSQLRLAAAKHLLKLCCSKALDKIFSPRDFNRLTRIVQDALPEVRAGFNGALKKYNGQNLLPRRFYSFMFLYAFEPKKSTKEATVTFLKARASSFAKNGDQLLEGVFSQFLSLLAHHQDFSTAPEDLKDFVDYIIFYLKIVATEANLAIIYSIAQRMKTVQDGIDPDKSENLYVLSDLAEAIIRIFQEQRGWSLQIFPGKTHLPQGIFARMPSHAMALEIAEKRFVPEELAEELEDLVKERMKPKKRKAERTDATSNHAVKKTRSSTTKPAARKATKAPKAAKPAKTPKKRVADAVPSSDRRKSARASNARNYAEPDSDEENEGYEEGAANDWDGSEMDVDRENDQEGDKDRELTSTPPTSDPTPAPATAVTRREKQRAEKKTAEKNAMEKKATKKKHQQLPARASRATRNTKKAAEVYDMPGDSDDELSDAPDDMEA